MRLSAGMSLSWLIAKVVIFLLMIMQMTDTVIIAYQQF